MPGALLAALVLGVVGALGGWGGPWLIARIPEPASDADPDVDPDAEPGPAGEPKEPYRAIAALPRAGLWLAVVAGLAGVLVGARLGWHGSLLPWAWLLPIGVILSLVDWRTRLLPTYLIAPSYAVVVALVLLGALLDQDRSRLWAAVAGWAVMGGLYLLLWLIYPAGMGYGDVRLSGLFGLALGYVGLAPVFVGAWLGFLLGGVGGLVLSRLGRTTRKAYPMGPFMTAGVILGVLIGGPLASGLGY